MNLKRAKLISLSLAFLAGCTRTPADHSGMGNSWRGPGFQDQGIKKEG